MDRLIELLFVRGTLAFVVGMVLEFAFIMLVTGILPEMEITSRLINHDQPWQTILSFAIFHVLGWIIVSLDWPAFSDSGQQSDVVARFRVEEDGHIYEGIVRKG